MNLSIFKYILNKEIETVKTSGHQITTGGPKDLEKVELVEYEEKEKFTVSK